MGKSESYLIEFISSGKALKVTAVDPESGTEASIVGDPKMSRDALSKLAVQKLLYVMNKARNDQDDDRPGILV
ncbi:MULTISPECIES: hypothetical protein [unclassified Iodidimonas]|uniref:DUF6898 family protein n=1 Tax=unclassified Iodidimonas TaxID=2626145 RepID=UPI00248285F4|nr:MULTISPECIES: hypothetical protein [unclassified Iodidimonas]